MRNITANIHSFDEHEAKNEKVLTKMWKQNIIYFPSLPSHHYLSPFSSLLSAITSIKKIPEMDDSSGTRKCAAVNDTLNGEAFREVNNSN